MQQSNETPKRRFSLGGRLAVALALVAAFAIGFMLRGGPGEEPGSGAEDPQAQLAPKAWTCSMHPQIMLPTPGQCPICFMDLIPVADDSDEDLGPRTLVLSEAAVALAEIQTATVTTGDIGGSVKLIGEVAYDETRYRTISAWVPGRVDTLFVDYTGTRVERGQPLVALYSPDLYAAQAELLNAVRAERELRQSSDAAMRETARATVRSARERLKLWGLSAAQVDRIATQEAAQEHLVIGSPLSGVVVHKNVTEGMYVQTGTRLYTVADLSQVWVTLSAYESDLAWLKTGQPVDFTVGALPGESFSGRIIFIDPVLDSRTRTVEVRIAVDNRDGHLKPGMFVKAMVQAAVPSEQVARPVVIPATAPLITGRRAVVYVQVPEAPKPTFVGREVVLGPRLGDHYLVQSGLEVGEVVVTRGNFKLDSALQIQAKPSMMNPVPADEGMTPEHENAAALATAGEMPPPGDVEAVDAPLVFRQQLDDVLAAYLELQAALAADEEGDLPGVAAMQAAMDAVDPEPLSAEARAVWLSSLPPLRAAVATLAAATDLAARREALRPLTPELWSVLDRFGVARTETVRLFHCPMAHDYAGADWIQLAPGTVNPYFGASMLRCGSQIDSLSTSGSGD